MSQPKDRKRKMDALISGDNSKAHASQEGSSSAKTACVAQGSASGDSQVTVGHDYVTVLRDVESPSSQPVIHTHCCDQEDVWQHKYPLPLGKFPPKTIKTGNKYYDAIIPELHKIGYRPLQILTKGRSGTVLLAQDVRPGVEMKDSECQPVAIKLQSGKRRKQTMPQPNRGEAEIERTDEMLLHQRLQHQNVVSMLNIVCFQGRMGIVLEFCESGNLETLLRAHDAKFISENIARRYLRQLHSGLEYVHLSGVAHRDICPANILVGSDNTLKLCDFSQAINFSLGDPLPFDLAGTTGYQAPEMLLNHEPGSSHPYDPRRADLWSLGCVLYHMVLGRLPYGRVRTAEEARSLKPLAFPAPHVLILSQQIKDLLTGMLCYVANSRFTLNRVRNNEWFFMKSDTVHIGSFYLVRQPQKIADGERERLVKAEYEI